MRHNAKISYIFQLHYSNLTQKPTKIPDFILLFQISESIPLLHNREILV